MDTSKNLSQVIRERLKADNKRFWAGDNIAEYISDEERPLLIDEATQAFEKVLDTLIIDRENDPKGIKFMRWLNLPENRAFRTKPGRV
jgi:GTP cyclohydrolase I